ncbi:MAG TPA: ROK family protein [Oligoflexia bacterium]|nr:ROK family protein [Oligoflexia bacterium]
MRIGIDLGGTKIEVLVLDRSGAELFRKRAATPQGDYEGTIREMVALVTGAELATGVRNCTIGVAIPGAESSKTGLIKNSNSLCLIGKPFSKDLADAFGRPVRLANDANCFALSETTDGAAKNRKLVFGVILGTGVGGGLVVNGQVIAGANSIAGEWGHNPLPWMAINEYPGPECYCGKRGCIETFLSGKALERMYEEATRKSLLAKEITKLAEKGDATAGKLLEHYEDRLARALIHLINILDPETIVLGGGMSNEDRLYRNVPERWKKYMFSDALDTELVKAKHGDSSGVRGAAWLWPEEGV